MGDMADGHGQIGVIAAVEPNGDEFVLNMYQDD